MAESKGAEAVRPGSIPRRGWWSVLKRVFGNVGDDNVSLVAAGVAFYALLALFPGLAALVSLFGLVADPQQVETQLQAVSDVLPDAVWQIINNQLTTVAGASSDSLTLAAVISLLIALFGATRGTRAAMIAMNIAYNEEERRGFIGFNLAAIGLTLLFVLMAILALLAVIVIPAVLSFLGVGGFLAWLISIARWVVLAGAVILALAVLYRLGPSRRGARWVWLSWGATLAAVSWLLASILFSVYVSNFANYNATYGSFGAVVILLFWFYITAYVIILGAELNAELEHQTAQDTTVGDDRPMGERGAYFADRVAEQ
jgi:membrane protein